MATSTRVASSYQKLTVEELEGGNLANALRNLGYTHTLSQCLSGAVRLWGSTLASGWASWSKNEIDEWYVGLGSLATNESGWGLSVSSPISTDPLKKEPLLQLEAYVQKKMADGLFLTPGIVRVQRGDTKKDVIMLRSEYRF